MQEIKKERESMIYPTLEELSKQGKYNRYAITMAAAKGARMVTEEYVMEREHAEQLIARKETDKPLAALIDEELRDEKAVRTSVHRLRNGEFLIEEESANAEEPQTAEESAEDGAEEEAREEAEVSDASKDADAGEEPQN